MSKKSAPKARTTRRTSQTIDTSTAVPPIVAGLLALLEEEVTASDADEMGRALAAARRALRDPLRSEWLETKDTAWRFIVSEAARGPWKHLHAAIEKLERPEDSDFNATTGDFHNLYAGPALAMGIALAYVFLQEGGRR